MTKKTKEAVAPEERSADEKKKALTAAIKAIEKEYGKNSVMRLGDRAVQNTPVLPTGILELDLALGVGGMPRGRVIEIYGPESTGKTTVALHLIAETQRNGGVCAFIDAEHALDPVYARALGVDTDNLYISQPNTGEEGLDIAEALGRSGALDLIVVDSVAALVPKAEIEGLMGDSVVGVQARLMSKAMRKLAPVMGKSDTAIVFINQLRLKVGIVYGNPEVTSGGNALKYYATIRLDVRKGPAIKKGEETIGHLTKIKVAKNKVAPPFKTVEADMIYGHGIDRTSSILNTALKLGVLSKSGTWMYYGETRLGQGRENARKYLLEHPDVAKEVTDKIFEKVRGGEGEENTADISVSTDENGQLMMDDSVQPAAEEEAPVPPEDESGEENWE